MPTSSFLRGPLLSERIALTGGKATGFDYLRVVLATLLICFHSVVTSQGIEAQTRFNQTPLGQAVDLILPMFFSLSGFLVTGSLLRARSLTTYLGLRALRIYPAPAACALLFALVVGPVLTTLPLAGYFGHPLWRQYLENVVGVIQYRLPGVFEHNPTQEVNSQLWTIPWEVRCYLVLAGLALLGLHRRRGLFLLLVAVPLLAQEAATVLLDRQAWGGRILVYCFMAGVCLHLFRDRVRWSPALFAGAAVLSPLCMTHPKLLYAAPLPVAYLTVWLGLLNPRKIRLLQGGDYSYGLYVFGYPIQQTLVAVVPLASAWWGNLLLALPLSFGAAWLSWHLVEGPALRQKVWLYRLEAKLPGNPFPGWTDRLLGRLLAGGRASSPR